MASYTDLWIDESAQVRCERHLTADHPHGRPVLTIEGRAGGDRVTVHATDGRMRRIWEEIGAYLRAHADQMEADAPLMGCPRCGHTKFKPVDITGGVPVLDFICQGCFFRWRREDLRPVAPIPAEAATGSEEPAGLDGLASVFFGGRQAFDLLETGRRNCPEQVP